MVVRCLEQPSWEAWNSNSDKLIVDGSEDKTFNTIFPSVWCGGMLSDLLRATPWCRWEIVEVGGGSGVMRLFMGSMAMAVAHLRHICAAHDSGLAADFQK